MAEPAAKKRVIGLALFASSALTVLVAILVGTGVVPVGESARPLLIGVLAIVAVVDLFVGWRFLMASAE
jgi:p-aminobenzoyl-glutamate transporter AbgT